MQPSYLDAWNANIKAWTILCQTVGKKKAKDARRVERLLQGELCNAKMNLQNSLNDENLTCTLMSIKDHLRKFQNQKIKGLKTRAKLNWLDSGDKGSKFFFHMLKVKEAKVNINAIWDNNAHITDSQEILQCFSLCYQKLFASEEVNEEHKQARILIKQLTPPKINEEDCEILGCPISKEEISMAISSMGNDRSPGPDGFPVEFYKKNMKWIVDDLHALNLEAISKGTLGKEINQGLIKLIPKEGDKTLVKNWRPITLLNVSYKILAKVVANRLIRILPKIISPTQTGFVKGRFILKNLVTYWESLEWAKASSQNGAMLLLDFEKAYDRIEWGFITQMLDSLGFPVSFCKIVQTLLSDANAVVEVNGLKSDNIILSRSIRQGCPLASALFVLATDAMHYILKDFNLSPKVKGITLPNKEEVINI